MTQGNENSHRKYEDPKMKTRREKGGRWMERCIKAKNRVTWMRKWGIEEKVRKI